MPRVADLTCMRVLFAVAFFGLFLSGQAYAQVFFISESEAEARLGLSSFEYETRVDRKNTVAITEPGILDQMNTKYVLQNDVVAPETAFTIKAANVTLDLNGHVVEYGRDTREACYGVVVEGYNKNIAVIHGTVRQSGAIDPADAAFSGSSPIAFPRNQPGSEIAGLVLEYHSAQTDGIFIPWGRAHIHHNVIRDNGTVITNRHNLKGAINANRARDMIVNDNYIQRARQCGILPGTDNTLCKRNLINIDSVSSNSYGIGYYGNKDWENDHWRCEENIIRGKGVHPIGIGALSLTANGVVAGNDVAAMVTKWNAEYKKAIGGAAFRTHWGAHNIMVEDNRFVYYGAPGVVDGQDSWGRCIWAAIKAGQHVVFRNNTIIGVSLGGNVKVPAIGICGNNESSELIFIGNSVASSWANVMLGDNYGYAAAYPRFVANDFVRLGSESDYYTIRSDASYYESTGIFVDNVMKDGASLKKMDIKLSSKKLRDVRFMKGYDIIVEMDGKRVSDATVRVADNTGTIVADGVTSEDGVFPVDLLEYGVTNASIPSMGKMVAPNTYAAYPYTVSVTYISGKAQRTIAKDAETVVLLILQ